MRFFGLERAIALSMMAGTDRTFTAHPQGAGHQLFAHIGQAALLLDLSMNFGFLKVTPIDQRTSAPVHQAIGIQPKPGSWPLASASNT
jgi:hypothetical protein